MCVCVWGGGGGVRACMCACLRVCPCVYIAIVKYFPCIRAVLAPCFIELLMFDR